MKVEHSCSIYSCCRSDSASGSKGTVYTTKGKFILPGRDSDARIDNTDYK